MYISKHAIFNLLIVMKSDDQVASEIYILLIVMKFDDQVANNMFILLIVMKSDDQIILCREGCLAEVAV